MDDGPWQVQTLGPSQGAGVPREDRMKTLLCCRAGAMSIALAMVVGSGIVRAQQGTAPQVTIDNDDIGGVVRSPNGPEAGVWVIAETGDLATKFTRIVVTDDQGRYVIPD